MERNNERAEVGEKVIVVGERERERERENEGGRFFGGRELSSCGMKYQSNYKQTIMPGLLPAYSCIICSLSRAV